MGDHYIVELFFDGDRNEEIVPGVRSKLWRILVWDTEPGISEIDPDAQYSDACPGQTFSYSVGRDKARALIKELRSETTVYFAEVIPAVSVIDKPPKFDHRGTGSVKYRGSTGDEWQQRADYNHGLLENSDEGGTMR